MQHRLEDLDHHSNDLAAASEAVTHGIVIVAPGGRVVFSNSVADRLLASDDGLRTREGCVEAATRPGDAQLRHAIDRALAPGDGHRCGSSLLCTRPCGRRPYVIHVLPLDETSFASPGS